MITQADPSEAQINELVKLFNTEQLDSVVNEIHKLQTQYPSSSALFNLQGSAYLKLGNYEAAIANFQRATEERPDCAQFFNNLAQAYKLNNNVEAAKDCLRQSLLIDPEAAESHFRLGLLEQLTNNPGAAKERFTETVRLRPDFAGAHNNLGLIYVSEGNWREAILCHQKAVEVNPKSPTAHKNLGTALQRVGEYAQSEISLQRAISLKADYLEAFITLGDTLRLSNRLDEAIEAYKSAIQIDSTCANAHQGLGRVFQKQKLNTLSRESFERALKANPNDLLSHFNLGIIHSQLGDLETALTYFSKSIELDPEFVAAHKNKCELLEKLNQTDQLELAIADAKGSNSAVLKELQYFEALIAFRKKDYATALERIESLPLDRASDSDSIRALKLKADCLNALNQSDLAFSAYLEMNSQIRANDQFDWRSADYYFSRVRAHAEALSKLRDAGQYRNNRVSPGYSPAFLIGFPRSGTTLLDTILRSHSEIAVVEEKPTLSRTLEGVDQELQLKDLELLPESDIDPLRQRYLGELSKHTDISSQICTIDKMPLNIIHSPLIAQLFPAAKFIMTIRHPLDCILSCFMQNFRLNAAMGNMLELDRIVELYCNAMTLWELSHERYALDAKIIRYEDLVLNLESEVTKLLMFLNLKWEPGLADYKTTAERRGRIHTPSYSQVVQPLYTTASYRWKSYRNHLEKYFERVTPWVEKFGYEL